jgi:4-amino-4-deoxy-L-arabinose transferase-like glycosyltransferase
LNWFRIHGRTVAYVVIMVVLVSFCLGIGLTRLERLSWEDDEGTFLATAQSVFVGHALYREVWFNYLPGFMAILVAAFHLGDVTVEAARSAMVMCAGLLLVGMAELARQLGGRRAGIVAAALLVITPNFVRLGRAVMAEVPATALTVWALLAALLFLRSGRLAWLIGAGLLTGGAILIKYPTAVTIIPVAAAVFLRPVGTGPRSFRWHVIGRMGLLALSVAVPIILMLIPFDMSAVWNQVVGTYLNSHAAYDVVLRKNVGKVASYFDQNNWGLVALGCVGLACLFHRERAEGWFGATWVGSYLISILGHSPLAGHHMFLLLVPTTLLASIALGHLSRPSLNALRTHQRLLLGALFLGLAVYMLSLPEMLDVTAGRLEWAGDDQEEEWEAVQLISQHTAAEDYVISDFPMIAFRAQRRTPPWLTNLSGMRFRTGGVTEEDLRQNTLGYHVRAVVMWENKLYKKAPHYVSWVEDDCDSVYDDVKPDPADTDDDKVRRILICPKM